MRSSKVCLGKYEGKELRKLHLSHILLTQELVVRLQGGLLHSLIDLAHLVDEDVLSKNTTCLPMQ